MAGRSRSPSINNEKQTPASTRKKKKGEAIADEEDHDDSKKTSKPDGDRKSKRPFPAMSPERLDEDFFHYANAAHAVMRDSELSSKQHDMATRWMQKLLSETYSDVESKKNRNIFLSNLLLQVADGVLVPPLLQVPPSGPLPNASIAFKLSAIADHERFEKAADSALEPSGYLHQSTDGRTYIASKTLDNESGVCAFIGVSVGGTEPVWLKPSGEEASLPEREDLEVSEIEVRGDDAIFKEIEPGTSASVILGKRKSHFERKGIVEFYETVLYKIEEAKADKNFPFDGPTDSLLRKLLDETRCELKSQGATDGDCSYLVLLETLEGKIKCLLENAKKRDAEIKKIATEENVMENDAKLVDMSSIMAFDPTDDIWKAAASGEPSEEVTNQLREFYPACIINTLYMLLERQRQIIIDQEKKAHEQLVAAMKAELLANVREVVVRYKIAERDFNHIMRALKQAESIIKERGLDSNHVSRRQEETLVQKELASVKKQVFHAQRQLDAARHATLEIDNKINEITCKIADLERRNKEASEMLRRDTLRWSKIICDMKAELKAQHTEIARLEKTLGSYQPDQSQQQQQELYC